MNIRAFRVLGIEPTTNQKVIRQAYVRLSQIYHPDRYVDASDAVREEAAGRMQSLTAAYNELRLAARRGAGAGSIEIFGDPKEEARRWRKAIAERDREEARRLERWQHWESLERQARARMRWESDIAASLAEDGSHNGSTQNRSEPASGRRASLLEIRLEEARGLRDGALVTLDGEEPPPPRARTAKPAQRSKKKVRT